MVQHHRLREPLSDLDALKVFEDTRALGSEWLNRIGLAHEIDVIWKMRRGGYTGDNGSDRSTVLLEITTEWFSREVLIEIWVDNVVQVERDRIEQAIVHELSHRLICATRPEGGIAKMEAPEINAEEHAANEVSRAILTAHRYGYVLGGKDAEERDPKWRSAIGAPVGGKDAAEREASRKETASGEVWKHLQALANGAPAGGKMIRHNELVDVRHASEDEALARELDARRHEVREEKRRAFLRGFGVHPDARAIEILHDGGPVAAKLVGEARSLGLSVKVIDVDECKGNPIRAYDPALSVGHAVETAMWAPPTPGGYVSVARVGDPPDAIRYSAVEPDEEASVDRITDLDEAKRVAKAWIGTARQFSRGVDYWRTKTIDLEAESGEKVDGAKVDRDRDRFLAEATARLREADEDLKAIEYGIKAIKGYARISNGRRPYIDLLKTARTTRREILARRYAIRQEIAALIPPSPAEPEPEEVRQLLASRKIVGERIAEVSERIARADAEAPVEWLIAERDAYKRDHAALTRRIADTRARYEAEKRRDSATIAGMTPIHIDPEQTGKIGIASNTERR